MRIAIVGVGAMACLFAAKLAPHAEIKILGSWRAGVDAIRAHGIRIESVGGAETVRVLATSDPDAIGMCGLVIIARKAWQTEAAAEQAARILAPNGGLALTLQNGLGNLEVIAQSVGVGRAVLGVTTQGATLIRPGQIRYAGGGATHLGVTPQTRARLESIAELLTRAGFETHLTDHVQELVWGKLAISCGINALTAVLRVPNGELLARVDAQELMVRAARECALVAQAQGIQLPVDETIARVREVARATAANQSSMLQDVLRDAPTEIEAINGAVARKGGELGVATPTNELLWHLVRALNYKQRETVA